jgi:hypothetical protein
MPQKQITWARHVGEVFHTSPRNGNDQNTIWLPRPDLEASLATQLDFPGVHVCLDGPTGSGKSSLATTVLSKTGRRFRVVQITKNTTWPDFCLRAVKSPLQGGPAINAEVTLGFEAGLPTALLKFAFGSREPDVTEPEIRKQFGDTVTEDVVCEKLANSEEVLVIDDFEKASPAIVERVAAMCKLMTQTFENAAAKLVIVGTDDVYARLTTNNKSLEDRLIEISIGSFDQRGDSWRFIHQGLSALRIANPVTDFNNGKSWVSRADLTNCMDAVYVAADGLPKALNVLGREIAMKGSWDRSRVSTKDILHACKKTPEKNYLHYASAYPGIVRISKDPAIASVLRYMYQVGVAKIHRLHEVVTHLSSAFSETDVRNALGELVTLNFIVQTGFHKDVFFVENPTLAHTLAVIASFPERFNLPHAMHAEIRQLSLPLFADVFQPISK